jgi:hypothetical protein
MRTIRTITVGLLAALAVIAAPLVGTADASTSPDASTSDNVVPMGPTDYPWGG